MRKFLTKHARQKTRIPVVECYGKHGLKDAKNLYREYLDHRLENDSYKVIDVGAIHIDVN